MTEPDKLGAGDRVGVPPALPRQEPPRRARKMTPMTAPAWVVVRATLDFSSGGRHFQRDEMATVDATLDGVKRYLRNGWLEPIPAAEQPRIRDGANGPELDENET